jgi:outer membrane receptor protein involved in Fe transport
MKKQLNLIFCTLFIALFFSSQVHAQNIPVSIKVVNQKKEPVAFATITVVNRLDSLQLIKKVADSSGIASFNLTKEGQYTVRITSINYQPVEKGISITGNKTSFSFTTEPLGKTMEAAVITSKKPLMRQEDDKTIIDPENLVAASTSGYEVIEKTPGLFVDQDGNIYISSLTPATVQINGRDLKMSAADVATMLKSFPPSAIQRIEVIRTPSASQDASGSGGIVNVVLKKGFKPGLTGSINAGMQQGTYGNQFAGFNINNNNGQKSFYISVNYNRRNNYEKIISDRIFAPDTMLTQDAFTKYPADAYNGNYIYSFSKNKWDFELSGNTSLTNTNSKSDNSSLIEKISSGSTISSNLNRTSNDNKSFLLGNGFEAKLKIDSLGSEWFSQVFHYYTHNTGDQLYTTTYYLPSPAFFTGDGKADNNRNLFSAKSDLKLKLKKKLTIETGIKSTMHLFRNNTEYYRTVNNIRSKDNNRTNTFNYDENINSAYLQAAKTFGKNVVLKAGTRLENTNMKGRQLIPRDISFNIHRTDLFPYIYLSKNLMKIAGYDLRAYLVYRRSISRPGYDQLNPFPKLIDQYLTEIGNPSLKPQFTKNYEANVSVDERPILAVGLNDTKDIFSQVTYQADSSSSQALRTYDNLGKNKEWYFRGLGALPPGGKYFFVLGAQYNYNIYDGLYENKPLSFKKGTWTFFTYHTYKIDKRSVLTVNGFIRLKGQQQLYELGPFGMLNASINRKFVKEKLIVTISMNDMFFTNKIDFSLKQGSLDVNGRRYNDTQRLGINLRYNFGIRKKEENNMFNVESPEKTN